MTVGSSSKLPHSLCAEFSEKLSLSFVSFSAADVSIALAWSDRWLC